MNLLIPDGFNVFKFGGHCVVPGTRIYLRREVDNKQCVGIVQDDGTLAIEAQ